MGDKTPATATTQTGQKVLRIYGGRLYDDILAIEAEARADALREAAERVRALDVRVMHLDDVLAILTEQER